jgi:type VI protein secretion system component VasK
VLVLLLLFSDLILLLRLLLLLLLVLLLVLLLLVLLVLVLLLLVLLVLVLLLLLLLVLLLVLLALVFLVGTSQPKQEERSHTPERITSSDNKSDPSRASSSIDTYTNRILHPLSTQGENHTILCSSTHDQTMETGYP